MYPALYNLCRQFFNDPHDIVSALNNGMLKVYKNIRKYDSQKGEIFNWIYTIVRNEALTYLKSKKKIVDLNFDSVLFVADCFDPFEKLDFNETFQMLEKLPGCTKVVCSLFYFENFSIKEIAKLLDVKEGTVKWHLNESRTRLKTLLSSNTNFAKYGA